MKPAMIKDVKAKFMAYLASTHGDLSAMKLVDGIQAIIGFQKSVKFPWTAPKSQDGDMLLVQWFSDDSKKTVTFDFNRQLIEKSNDDDDEGILQVSVYFIFRHDPAVSFAGGNRWDHEDGTVTRFRKSVLALPPFVAFSKAKIQKVKISCDRAG